MHTYRRTPRSRRFTLIEFIIVLALIGILGAVVVAAVAGADHRSLDGPVTGGIGDSDDFAAARRAAESFGFTNVTFRHIDFPSTLGCDAEDSTYDAVARNQREQEVHLTICCEGFDAPHKGCTVRVR